MGTRATVHIVDGEKTIASIYRKMDGMPSGLGDELKHYLSFSKLVNVYRGNDEAPDAFNGIQCLGAYLIGVLKIFPYQEAKNAIGNVYLTDKNDRQEYNYFISAAPKDKFDQIFVTLKVTDEGGKILFEGLIRDFESEKIEE